MPMEVFYTFLFGLTKLKLNFAPLLPIVMLYHFYGTQYVPYYSIVTYINHKLLPGHSIA